MANLHRSGVAFADHQPLFTSTDHLLPTATNMNNAGSYIPSVPEDIDGTIRSNPPDMGAYEFAPDPVIITTAATSVTLNSATMNGTVNAGNFTCNIFFDWGLTTAYGSMIAGFPTQVTGNAVISISAGITGLLPLTTYHFRARGVTTGGLTVYGVILPSPRLIVCHRWSLYMGRFLYAISRPIMFIIPKQA